MVPPLPRSFRSSGLHSACLVTALCLAGLTPLPAAEGTGQRSSGSTSVWSHVFPVQTVPPRVPEVNLSPVVQPNPPSIPIDEYARRKQDAARNTRLLFPQPPGRELSGAPFPRVPEPPPSLASTAAFTWEGIGQTIYSPPNPEIAVGPEDVILAVNGAITRFDRNGKSSYTASFFSWFESLMPVICPSTYRQCLISDPSVRYDQIHGRFLFVAQAHDFITNRANFALSVSDGPTFSGGWTHWALDARHEDTVITGNWADFPRLGADAVAVYLTANMFSVSNRFQYAKVRILKKSELYNTATKTLTYQDIWDLKNEDGTAVTSLHPPQFRGRTGDVTAGGILVNASDKAKATYLTVWKIDDPAGPAPTASRSTISGFWPYDYPASAPQLGGPTQLDTNDSRVLKAIVRDGVLFCARNTGYADNPVTVTWDRIDLKTMTLVSQARLTNVNAFYPILEIPATMGPGGVLPNKLLAGTTTSPSGALAFAGMTEVKAGEAYYDISSGLSRWGDHNGSALDPVSGGMWLIGQYAGQPSMGLGQWGTRAAYYPWVSTQSFSDVPASSPYFDFVNTMALWGITNGCTATNYCPSNPATRGETAVFIIRALFGDEFAYPSTPYFTDIPASHPFFPFVQKMRELGLTGGCSETQYCPDDLIARWQMAVFLIRAKLHALQGDDFTFPAAPYFSDVASEDVAFRFVQKLRESGITAGCTADRFGPDATVTREQMAVFVVRSFLN